MATAMGNSLVVVCNPGMPLSLCLALSLPRSLSASLSLCLTLSLPLSLTSRPVRVLLLCVCVLGLHPRGGPGKYSTYFLAVAARPLTLCFVTKASELLHNSVVACLPSPRFLSSFVHKQTA